MINLPESTIENMGDAIRDYDIPPEQMDIYESERLNDEPK
jgi:hypothetical protein